MKKKIQTPDGPMSAYFSEPKNPAKSKIKALVVIQEAYGVNHHIQELCNRFAAEGYLALAPELFHREGDGVEFPYGDFSKVLPTFSKLTNDSIRMDIEASLEFLDKELKIPRAHVAVIGYCVGGLAAMIAATSQRIGGAIAYYGGGMVRHRPEFKLSPILQDFEKIECPVLLFFGDQDQSIPMEDVRAIEAELNAKKKNYELVVYPGVGHAFSNDDRPSFDPTATKAAWSKTLQWLSSR